MRNRAKISGVRAGHLNDDKVSVSRKPRQTWTGSRDKCDCGSKEECPRRYCAWLFSR